MTHLSFLFNGIVAFQVFLNDSSIPVRETRPVQKELFIKPYKRDVGYMGSTNTNQKTNKQ